ncbi:hypothetical protein H4R20_005239, partial [Coemansia guatemalensis]
MLGFPAGLTAAGGGNRYKAIGVNRILLVLTRGLHHLCHSLLGHDRSVVDSSETCMQPGSSSGDRTHSHWLAAGDTDDEVEMGRCGHVSGASSASSLRSAVLNMDTRPAASTRNQHMNANSGRGTVVLLTAFVAAAIWAPKYVMVEGRNNFPSRSSVIVWMRGLLNLGFSFANVICNAMLLIGIGKQLRKQPDHSPIAFVRYFAPLCMLSILLLWPMLEDPADVLAKLDAHRLVPCLGVAALGALSLIARVAMIRVPVSDGPVGVA